MIILLIFACLGNLSLSDATNWIDTMTDVKIYNSASKMMESDISNVDESGVDTLIHLLRHNNQNDYEQTRLLLDPLKEQQNKLQGDIKKVRTMISDIVNKKGNKDHEFEDLSKLIKHIRNHINTIAPKSS